VERGIYICVLNFNLYKTMKKLLVLLLAITPMVACSKGDSPKKGDFSGFEYPTIHFQNNAAGTSGGAAINRLLPEPEAFIKEHVLDVVSTLYTSDADSNIPAVSSITFLVDPDYDGVAQKEGDRNIIIRFNPGHIEGSTYNTDDKKALELAGVLNHELTHVYQQQPKGAGNYGDNGQMWAFIEGVADGVRPLLGDYADGDTGSSKPDADASYMSGYRTTGWFLVWLQREKDPDFMRKFNATAATINPWSWDRAMQSIFGEEATADSLWEEYLTTF
jgi:hypothetical protein